MHGVRRWLLEVLEQGVGGVVVQQVGAEDEVDAAVGLERPHVQVAPQLADRVDADHLAERLERIDVGVLRARRTDELPRERPGKLSLADPVRAVEEVCVRRPLVERRVQQALRLLLLGEAVEPRHSATSAPTVAVTCAASCSGGSAPSRTTYRSGVAATSVR